MKGKIFNAQEVQSILDGSKVIFREVIKPQRNGELASIFQKYSDVFCFEDKFGSIQTVKCPYKVGQKIFCKESFSMSRGLEWHQCHDVWYWANGNPEYGDWTKPKPAQRMKQEHSRLFPIIKSIGVERLADISEEDAIKEGVPKIGFHDLLNREQSNGFLSRISGKEYKYYPQEFKKLWNATHKKPEEKFWGIAVRLGCNYGGG